MDPHSFFADPDPAVFINADPDPAVFLMRVQIQLFFNADTDPSSKTVFKMTS